MSYGHIAAYLLATLGLALAFHIAYHLVFGRPLGWLVYAMETSGYGYRYDEGFDADDAVMYLALAMMAFAAALAWPLTLAVAVFAVALSLLRLWRGAS